eukprot:CAMPEP_0183526696 /NCGR_PEP_ID=MMETSP0371-20130417/21503_1 /TAXON_ID=268820 /ORGANISM="Peridinium aciculiferum, Strain PAER-2" /LENGTH=48 /DNA_ID= /DNA_START= /DNA_END= /DNA_ORIENTATION=
MQRTVGSNMVSVLAISLKGALQARACAAEATATAMAAAMAAAGSRGAR